MEILFVSTSSQDGAQVKVKCLLQYKCVFVRVYLCMYLCMRVFLIKYANKVVRVFGIFEITNKTLRQRVQLSEALYIF